jgi:hypothetical protein
MQTGMKWGKRGRPSKQAIAERLGIPVNGIVPRKDAVIITDTRTDADILQEMESRFSMVHKLTTSLCDGNVRALTISGAPGVGKSYTVHQILDAKNVNHSVVGGDISPLGLFKMAYDYRNKGDVLVFDDADSIFTDPVSANILKHICDSSETRRVSWIKESKVLESENIPNQFNFNGSVIFISNLNFDNIVAQGRSMAPHIDAIRDRSIYIDLLLHNRRQIFVWVKHIALQSGLFLREGVSHEVGQEILDFIEENIDRLSRLSFRTINKACQLYLAMGEEDWREAATVSLCSSVR